MKCPVCDNVKMREVEKEGVLIDICPECKGVWLDRGELDKLMGLIRESNQDTGENRRDNNYDRERYDQDKYKQENQNMYKSEYKKKKKFDFDFFDIF